MEILSMTDLGFLPQLLTLHRSLIEHAGEFKLRVLCMDDASRAFLEQRALANTELHTLAELERADPALVATRAERSWTEFCWTTAPAFTRYALELARPRSVLAWVDADVEFNQDPRRLLDELKDGSILLTPHEYRRAFPGAAQADLLTRAYGRFNGGTLLLRRDQQGLAAAGLWRERTLAWCHNRREPGLFGNQLHLDDFPHRFSRARVMAVPGGVMGPWHGGGFEVRKGGARGPTANQRPVIAYHFESLRLRRRGNAVRVPNANVFNLRGIPQPIEARAAPHYRISASERRVFWRPYARRLTAAVADVLAAEPAFARSLLPPAGAGERLGVLRKQLSLQASRIQIPQLQAGRARAEPQRPTEAAVAEAGAASTREQGRCALALR